MDRHMYIHNNAAGKKCVFSRDCTLLLFYVYSIFLFHIELYIDIN